MFATHFPLVVAGLDRFTLIVLSLAAAQAHQDLGEPTVAEVELQGDDGVPLKRCQQPL